MEVRITIGNKTWIVPAGAINSLISWLNVNAVELGQQKQEIREVQQNKGIDPRQLIMENK